VLASVVTTLFERFDYDGSGTMNSTDELQQLAIGVLFALNTNHQGQVVVPEIPGTVLVEGMVSELRAQGDFDWSLEDTIAWMCGHAAKWRNGEHTAPPPKPEAQQNNDSEDTNEAPSSGIDDATRCLCEIAIADVVSELFNRFDYDGSGRLDSEEELRQLTMGVLFAFKMKHADIIPTPKVDSSELFAQMMETAKRPIDLSEQEYNEWMLTHVEQWQAASNTSS
jgi:hypothetical protein